MLLYAFLAVWKILEALLLSESQSVAQLISALGFTLGSSVSR